MTGALRERAYRGAVVALGIAMLGVSAQAEQPVPSFKAMDSIRAESMTRSLPNGEETTSVSKGKFKVEFVLPISGGTAAFTGTTLFRLSFGALKREFHLSDDPDWKAGATSARFNVYAGTGNEKVRSVLGTVRLKWTRDRLEGRMEGETPAIPSPVAAQYANQLTGKVEAEADARIVFDQSVQEFRVQLKGNVKRREASGGDISGSATTVDLKGEGKPATSERQEK